MFVIDRLDVCVCFLTIAECRSISVEFLYRLTRHSAPDLMNSMDIKVPKTIMVHCLISIKSEGP